jgi:transcription elongation factor Elf1
MRPTCPVCNQRECAVNYVRDGRTHYRSRCENCIRRDRQLPRRRPRWQAAGYEKSRTCDRCGFRAKYAAQLMVFHVDGRLDNVEMRNLRTVCRNCEVELARSDFTWQRGDLEPDH